MAGTSSGTTVLDSATRELTRAVLLFSLDGRARPRGTASGVLVDRLDFGRFEPHLRSSEAVLPVPVLVARLAPDELRPPDGDHGLALAAAELLVLATPRGDVTLLVDCGFAADTAPDALAAWLADTCFDRRRIRLGDRPLLDVVNERLALPTPSPTARTSTNWSFPAGGCCVTC